MPQGFAGESFGIEKSQMNYVQFLQMKIWIPKNQKTSLGSTKTTKARSHPHPRKRAFCALRTILGRVSEPWAKPQLLTIVLGSQWLQNPAVNAGEHGAPNPVLLGQARLTGTKH